MIVTSDPRKIMPRAWMTSTLQILKANHKMSDEQIIEWFAKHYAIKMTPAWIRKALYGAHQYKT